MRRRLEAYPAAGGRERGQERVKDEGWPFSPSPRPSPAATRVLFTGRRFAGEEVTRRGIGFQPVREMILLLRLAVPADRCRADLFGGISKVGPITRMIPNAV